MVNERTWASELGERLQKALNTKLPQNSNIRVDAHRRIIYAHEVENYEGENPIRSRNSYFETDISVWDERDDGTFTPRVVIETKLRKVSTHDALTYSTKASSHKQVHPYLRYGILVGEYGDRPLPGRLFRHGAYFDFMVIWDKLRSTSIEWRDFLSLIISEIKTSCTIEEMLRKNRMKRRPNIRLIYRQLKMK
jgi:hypothetical protein